MYANYPNVLKVLGRFDINGESKCLVVGSRLRNYDQASVECETGIMGFTGEPKVETMPHSNSRPPGKLASIKKSLFEDIQGVTDLHDCAVKTGTSCRYWIDLRKVSGSTWVYGDGTTVTKSGANGFFTAHFPSSATKACLL